MPLRQICGEHLTLASFCSIGKTARFDDPQGSRRFFRFRRLSIDIERAKFGLLWDAAHNGAKVC